MKATSITGAVWLGVAAAVSLASPVPNDSQATNFFGVGEVRSAVWSVQPSADNQEIRFSIDCTGFSAVEVTGGYSLRIPGQASSAKPRTPDLPRLAKLLPGIKGTRPVLTVQGKDPTNVTHVVVAAAEGFRLDDPAGATRSLRPYRQPDAGIFGKDEFWPLELGSVEEAGIGTQLVVRVECFPVQYNPEARTIRFYRRLEGVLRFEQSP